MKPVQKILKRCRRYITTRYPDTIALNLIGSYADGTAHSESDIDIVWVKKRRLDWKKHVEIEEHFNRRRGHPKVQLVPFEPRVLKWHFDHASTMAHAIQRGTVLYGKRTRFVRDLSRRELGLPTREWMSYWARHWITRLECARRSISMERRFHRRFCGKKCYCSCMDDIARVLVNLVILYLELKGIVPTSKSQAGNAIRRYAGGREMCTINLTLAKAGRDESLTLAQAGEILQVAGNFKRRLVARGLLKVQPAALP